jgi:hypothetical protein
MIIKLIFIGWARTRHRYPTPPNSPTIIGYATLLIIVSSVMSPLPTNTCSCFVGIEYTTENYIGSSISFNDHNPGGCWKKLLASNQKALPIRSRPMPKACHAAHRWDAELKIIFRSRIVKADKAWDQSPDKYFI